MKTARVITLFRCDKTCAGCCNIYSQIMSHAIRIKDFSELKSYDVICITGGEPLLQPDQTLEDIRAIRENCPTSLIYLYTALYTRRLPELMTKCDGIHFTLHEHATNSHITGFQQTVSTTQRRSKNCTSW